MLTLIYTSGTTGPPKGVQLDPPQPAGRGRRRSRSSSSSRDDGARDLLAAVGAHRRARRAPLPADRASGCRSPAATTRARSLAYLPAGAADAGSSPCRASGRSSRPGWRRCSPAQPDEQRKAAQAALAAAIEKVAPRAGGRAGARRRSPRRSPRPTSSSSRGLRAKLGLDQVEALNVGAAPTPRRGARVLPRDRRCRSPSCGACRETCGAGTVNPPEQDQDRHRRARRRRASRSSSTTTARCCARRRRDGGLPQPAREDRRGDRPTTAGCTPATSASSTRTAT